MTPMTPLMPMPPIPPIPQMTPQSRSQHALCPAPYTRTTAGSALPRRALPLFRPVLFVFSLFLFSLTTFALPVPASADQTNPAGTTITTNPGMKNDYAGEVLTNHGSIQTTSTGAALSQGMNLFKRHGY